MLYRDQPEGADAALVHCTSVRRRRRCVIETPTRSNQTTNRLEPRHRFSLVCCAIMLQSSSPLLMDMAQVQASNGGYTLAIHLAFMNRFSLDDLFRPLPDDPSACPALVPVQFPEKMCCYVAGQQRASRDSRAVAGVLHW